MESDMANAIRQLVEERGLSEELVKRTIEEMLVAAYKREFGTAENAEILFADDLSEVFLYAKKTVVQEDEISDPVVEISVEEALIENEDSESGDEIWIKLDPKSLKRVSTQIGKQKSRQSLREIQKDTLYSEYKDRVGELVVGYYQRERNGTIFVDLGKTEGVLPRRYQSPREVYRPNDRVRAMIYEVEKTPAGLQIVLTRTHTEFVRKIFELEVPEIYDRTIEIHKMVREAGYRTKMSVYSTRDDVDPVGACVGMRGVRIQTVVRELEGEKIDVLRYDSDVRSFITEALKPTEVEQVMILDEAKRQALAVVPEGQFSLAIGKQGLNVRLANRLTDWSIDVRTRSQVNDLDLEGESQRAAAALFGDVQEEITDVAELPGIAPRVAAVLKEGGIDLIETLVAMNEEQLRDIPNLSEPDIVDLLKMIDENVEIIDDSVQSGGASAEATDDQLEDYSMTTTQEENEEELVDVQSSLETDISSPLEEEVLQISDLPGLPDSLVNTLISKGIDDLVELVSMERQEIENIEGLSKEEIDTLIKVIEENVEIVEEDSNETNN